MTTPTSTTPDDPYVVLGISSYATEEEIRQRYLELIKQHPPERDADRFRQIQAAFHAANDPLTMARQLLVPPAESPTKWSDVLAEQTRHPPELTPEFLLSLGNKESAGDDPDSRKPAQEKNEHQKQYFVDAPHE